MTESELHRMRDTFWHVAIISMFTGIVFFTNLGGARLWDRDEPRNAGCAAEMMARGDWVVPMFNDELRHQKPVLLYWLVMSAYSVFGVNEFSARFWSAALAVATTFATYGIARRLTSPTIALYAAIALSTSMMFDVAARAVTPDSLLIFCSTMALMFYVLGTFSRSDNVTQLKAKGSWFPNGIPFVIAMYLMLGLGVLAKGPIGFLLPMAIIGLFMLIRSLPSRDEDTGGKATIRFLQWLKSLLSVIHPIHFLRTLWSMRPLTGAAIVLLVAAPWYFLVDARTDGDFTRLFFVGEHFGRATHPMENHSGGLWFYPLAILVGFFPWSIFWGPVVVGLLKRQPPKSGGVQNANPRNDISTTLMLCWVGVQVGVFSLVQTKLPSYVTPCYPALAILTASCIVGLAHRQSNINQGWLFAALAGLVVSGIGITLVVGFATINYLPSQTWLLTLGLIPLVGGVVAIWSLAKRRPRSVPVIFSLTALLFCTGLFGFGTVSLDGEQKSDQVLSQILPGTPIGTYGVLESSWVFYAERPIFELEIERTDQGSEESPAAIPAREKFWQRKPQPTVESFLQANPGAMFITSDDHVDAIKSQLPEGYEVIQTAEYFLKNKNLVLLGCHSVGFQSASDAHAKMQSAARPDASANRR